MKARLLLVIALGTALVALPAAALARSSHAASNSQHYPDSTGEDPQAPDITSIDVSNDDSGLITFKVNISNRPTLTSDMTILIFLNTDQNTSTGDPNALGADYAIELDPGTVNLFQWNGTTYAAAASQTSLTYSYDTTGATIDVAASDLNGTKSFSFGVIAISGITLDANGNPDFTNSHEDLAPDAGHGFFSYQVIAKLTLTQTAFTTAPSPARAGRRFSASLGANESDTNGPVTKGTVACSARVGGRHLTSTHSLSNGVASCFWNLPATAKGKTLRGTIAVTVQGTTLSKSFSVKVK
jgi:hypothetical protein